MSKKKIAIASGSRAEYHLLRLLMQEIKGSECLELQVFATGMHLSPEFGSTYHQIERDHIKIDKKIEMLLSSDTAVGVIKSMGLCMIGFADVFSEYRPDAMIILGDRFEMLAVAQAALITRIPVIHLHGGEQSIGAFDESIRHAITKLSHLHFVAHESYRKRVVQMGERPQHVFCYGPLVQDVIQNFSNVKREEIERRLNIVFQNQVFLITYHPETLSAASCNSLNEMLNALSEFKKTTFIFTKANADPDGRQINKRIEAFCTENQNSFLYDSLGQELYLSVMQVCDVVIGNSSSGVIEAPLIPKPSVNIGDRQKGRVRYVSIIDVEAKQTQIVQAIKKALSVEHSNRMRDMNINLKQNVAKAIRETIEKIDLKALMHKNFNDMDFAL